MIARLFWWIRIHSTVKLGNKDRFDKGPFLYYVRTYGWVGVPENCNFPLLYVVKYPCVGGWVVQKSLKTPLRNIKMAHMEQIDTKEPFPVTNLPFTSQG